MKNFIFLFFIFFLFGSFYSICDCDSFGEIFYTKEGITQKNYTARFVDRKVIQFAVLLEANKKYTFETYDKRGTRTESIKVDILTTRKEFVRSNVDSVGNVKERFFLYPPEKSLVYMQISVLTPKSSDCTCAYVIMFTDDL